MPHSMGPLHCRWSSCKFACIMMVSIFACRALSHGVSCAFELLVTVVQLMLQLQ